MIKVIRGRDTGKTRELLEECSKANGVFICKHPENIQTKCLSYGIKPVDAAGYSELLNVVDDRPAYVDEVENLLELLGVKGYSITND